jgi:hypothetical protein
MFNQILSSDEHWQALPDPYFAVQMVVGGVAALVTARISADDLESLPALREPILDLVHSMVRDR